MENGRDRQSCAFTTHTRDYTERDNPREDAGAIEKCAASVRFESRS